MNSELDLNYDQGEVADLHALAEAQSVLNRYPRIDASALDFIFTGIRNALER